MNFTCLTNKLSEYPAEKIVFVGLGNKLRCDDGAGLGFIECLQSRKEYLKSSFISAGKNPENYLQKILDYNPLAVVFADAADWNSEPGEVKFLNSEEIDNVDFSTHTFSIKLIEQYLAAGKQMAFYYIGIQRSSLEYGVCLSAPVKSAIKNFFAC